MTDTTTFYVYVLFRPDGRPCYVGKGRGGRVMDHYRRRAFNPHLAAIMALARTQGQELPWRIAAADMTESEALAVEKMLVAALGRNSEGGLLVNLTPGGDKGFKGGTHRPESRAKTSAALKGRTKTPEHVAAAAAAQRGGTKKSGWWSTEEGRAKQRQNNSGVFKTGHRHTPETIEKCRAAAIRQANSRRAHKEMQS